MREPIMCPSAEMSIAEGKSHVGIKDGGFGPDPDLSFLGDCENSSPIRHQN
jgi:hypothetical protein